VTRQRALVFFAVQGPAARFPSIKGIKNVSTITAKISWSVGPRKVFSG
jgi:hypothetical protein